MYVNVHVNVCDHEKLLEFFRSALVKEFHSQTGILFENNILKLKLFFEKDPPQESIYAFCECGNITYLEYNYSDTANNTSNKEAEKQDESTPEPATEEKSDDSADDNAAESTEGEDVKTSPPAATKKKKYTAKEKALSIPEFEEIAKTSNSKSDFLSGIIAFLEIPDELKEAFLQIISIYPELKKVTWDTILAALSERQVAFNSYNRRVLCDAVTKKLGIRFINAIATIDHILSEHTSAEEEKSGEAVGDSTVPDKEAKQTDAAATAEVTPNVEEPADIGAEEPKQNEGEDSSEEPDEEKALFTCMPKLVDSKHKANVLSIEGMLKAINPELSCAEKVEEATKILASKCLPLALDPKVLDTFIHFTQLATGGEEVSFDNSVINPDNVNESTIRMQILQWSTIVNQLSKMYDPELQQKVKSIDFLTELKQILS